MLSRRDMGAFGGLDIHGQLTPDSSQSTVTMGPYPLSFLVSILVIVLVPIRRVLRARTARLSLMRKYDCKAPKKYPQKDPLLGLDLVYATAQSAREGRFQESLQHRHETHGRTFQTTILGATVIYTIDPRVVSTVFSSAADRFGAAPIRLPPAECLVGKGIFTTDGTEWACSRELIKPCFARARVTDLTFLEVHVDRLLELIPRDGSTVDLQALFRLLVGRYDTIWHLIDNLIEVQSLDSSTDFLFGKSLDSLQSSESVRVKDFLDSFEIAQYGVDQRVRLGRLRFLCQGKRFSEACAAVHDFIDEYIARALDDMSAGQAKTSKPNNQHKEKYALVKEVGTVVKDKNDLRNQMMNFFIAGHESTAMALSSIFFNLSRSPIAWQKIRSEVIAVGNEPLTFETLKTMQYLRHVISESTRCGSWSPGSKNR